MDITWHGSTCVSLKGKNATVVIDPYNEKMAGMKLPKLSPDVILANADSELNHNLDIAGEQTTVFDWPGEYEARAVIVQGVAAYDRPREKDTDKKDEALPVILWSMNFDGFRICHLSNVGHKLTPEMLELIGNVDILFVPVGGDVGLNAGKAHEVIEQIDPRMVIPTNYTEAAAFLKEMGIHNPSYEKVLKIAAPSNLSQDQTEFKILEPVVG
ncbi:MBL fold metallo-hydrolase [Candidatus Gracilibacteria bacterium]|nr:MBL fold metallo-hydrolase [Candidatus Gracilibacteria bacterium]